MRLERESKADFCAEIIANPDDECGYSLAQSGTAACSCATDLCCTNHEFGHREAPVIYGTSLVETVIAFAGLLCVSISRQVTESLRSSALKSYFNAEAAEIRREILN